MEGGNIYNNTPDWSWNSGSVVKSYTSPGDPSMPANNLTWGNRGATSYASNFYVFHGENEGFSNIPATFTDGQSDTIVFLERWCQLRRRRLGQRPHLGRGRAGLRPRPEQRDPVLVGLGCDERQLLRRQPRQ